MSTLSDAQLLTFIRPLLRSSETVKVVAQGVVPAATHSKPAVETREEELERRRILAVVTNAGTANVEEGCIFLFRRKTTGELVVSSVVPVTHDFHISVAQVAPPTLDKEGKDEPDKRRARQPSPGKSGQFLVTVKSPSRDREFFLLSSSPSLKDVLSECRRLKGTAEAELNAQAPWNKTHHLTTTHAWLEHYQHQIMNISIDIIPRDGPDSAASEAPDDDHVPDALFHPPALSVPLSKRLSPASAGLPPTEDGAKADLILLRDDWIRKQLNKASRELREKKAPGSSTISLRICSFNVNGQDPPAPGEASELGSWIRAQPQHQVPIEPPSEASSVTAVSVAQETRKDETTPLPHPGKIEVTNVVVPDIIRPPTPIGHRATAMYNDSEPDLVVVGFQELDLSAEALIYREDPAREEAWTAAIIESLGRRSDGDEYIKVVSKQLVGMLIILFATKTVRPRVRDVRTSSAPVGILGLMGNKGAVALRCRVDGSVLTFVSSHLAAFEEMHDKRNYDWREIARKLLFLPSGIADVAPVLVAAQSHAEKDKTPVFATSTPTPSTPASAPSIPGLVTEANTPLGEPGHQRQLSVAESIHPLFDPKVVEASVLSVTEHVRVIEKATIWDTDCIFWNGDLNYRIDLPDIDVRELLGDTSHPTDKHNISTLLKWDQLKASQRMAKVFDGFEEAEITFLPTYRFESGLKADKNGYDIKRKPAWTDRILHMSSDALQVTQTGYTSHPEVQLSDHKPISATFDVYPDSMTSATRELLMTTLFRQLGNWILDDEPPNVRVNVETVDFGTVNFDVPVTRTFEVKNVAKTPCGFRFVSATENAPICEDWLKIDQQWGIILPGDSVTFQMTVHVTSSNAARLNSGQRRLEDTLVLHVLRGKDHFIAVNGSYTATCFANTLSWLARLPCSIREFADPGSTNKLALLAEEQATNAPNEVIRLIAWLMTNALDEDNLFLSPGDPAVVHTIREALDTGANFEDSLSAADAKSVADVLLAFLDSLPEPVIPWQLQATCAEVGDRDAAFEVLGELPAVNRNVWVSLTAFLHFLVEHVGGEATAKDQRIRSLAAVFAPILLKDDVATAPVSPLGKRTFLLHFLRG